MQLKRYFNRSLVDRILSIADGKVPRSPVLFFVAGILIIGIFGYLAVKAIIGVQQMIEMGIQFSPTMLLLSIACQIVGVFIAGWVWSDILNCLGVPSSYWFNLQVFCTSSLARKIPGGVWYAVSRVALYDQFAQSRLQTLLALIVETVTIMMGSAMNIMVGILLSLFFKQSTVQNSEWYLVIIIVSLFGFILGSPSVIRFFIKKIADEKKIDRDLPPITWIHTLRWMLGEFVVLALATGVGYFLLLSIDITKQMDFGILLSAFNLSVILSPISMWLPGNAGLRDGIVYLAIQSVNDENFSALVTLAWRIWVYILEIIAGLISAIFLNRYRKSIRHQ